jgi:hypothetical protein
MPKAENSGQNRAEQPSAAIQVIGLQSQEDCDEVLAQAREMLPKPGINITTDSKDVPAVVGVFAGIVAIISVVGPAVGPAIASGLAGAGLTEFIDWLKKHHRSPRVSADAAEGIAIADLVSKRGVVRYSCTIRKVLPGCDQPMTHPQNCFVFVFHDLAASENHSYLVSNEGEITSYETS